MTYPSMTSKSCCHVLYHILNIARASAFLLGDLRGKSFKVAWWPKGFFVRPAKTGTVTWERSVAMFFY